MKKNVLRLFIPLMVSFMISCGGSNSESDDISDQVEEMKSIEADAQETIEEIESETEQLEHEVDSLLREI